MQYIIFLDLMLIYDDLNLQFILLLRPLLKTLRFLQFFWRKNRDIIAYFCYIIERDKYIFSEFSSNRKIGLWTQVKWNELLWRWRRNFWVSTDFPIVSQANNHSKYGHIHSLKLRPGGSIPELIQVCDYDILIVLDELNTLIYVRPLNEW